MNDREAELRAAVAAHRAGDLAAARASYEAVLVADPEQPDALNLLGLIAQQTGDLARARALIERSIERRPESAATHYNLAIVRTAQGDIGGAIAAYEAAVACSPGFAQADANLGNLYLQAGRHDDALRAFDAAIAADPGFAAAYANRGAALIALERYADAIATLETGVRNAPPAPEIYANLGQAYRRSGRFAQGIAASEQALALRPGYVEASVNLALCACDSNDTERACATISDALARYPGNADVQCNAARIFYLDGRYAEAIAAAQEAIALRPGYAEAHVNLSLAQLHAGDFARGWDEYAWMWRVPSRRARYPYLDRAALWNGEPFAGRTLLIARDQGYGDAIQMARYLPAVKARGGKVILESPPPLAPLLRDLAGVDELRVLDDADAAVDAAIALHLPMCGLPGALRTTLATIPSAVPYLRAPADRRARWQPCLQRPGMLRVGILWSGNPGYASHYARSATLEDFEPLGALDGIAWFGLQKGSGEDRRGCGRLRVEPLGPAIGDFGDSAAIIAELDLVIATDTAIVHLAGALGRPVWTLLAFAPDWRWLSGRADSPWYPTMRLFRQPRPGAWAPVFAQVAGELATLRGSRSAGS